MNKQGKQPIPLGVLLRRSWWLLLVLVHVPALLGVGRALAEGAGATSLLTALALGATVAVFCLKVADVPFLRLGSRHGRAGVFVLVCCLVHHEVAVSEAAREVARATPAALAVGVAIEGLRRAAPAMRRLRDRLVDLVRRPMVLARFGLVALPGAWPVPRPVPATAAMPRAPPA